MKNKFIFCAILVALAAKVTSQTKAVSAPFSKGVNFSLWLQVPNADLIDENFFNEQDFKNVKALGCDAIRLPIHFENFSSGAPDYIISEKLFSVLDKAVRWANEQQIYLILDNHSWHNDIPTAKDIDKRLLKYWPQIAERYKNSGEYLAYELLNEPHGIDNKKWAKIQQAVINAIRAIDETHAIVVGGNDYNSYNSMCLLPEFSGGNIIYTFHFYDPMFFTHQGASWIPDLKGVRGVPFPYAKEKMPKKPKTQSWYYDNYIKDSSLKTMEANFDKAADFSVKRNAPVWCGEFGVLKNYVSSKERAVWYRIVADFLDDRNIARTSWDYYDSFGLFKSSGMDRFPDDLDTEILSALKYDIPEKTPQNLTWAENAKKTGNYSIYKDGFAKGLRTNVWLRNSEKIEIAKTEDRETILDFQKVRAYNGFRAFFIGGANFLQEKDSGYALEFEARTYEADLKMQAYFMNSDKTGEEWRAAADITSQMIPADGQWHKIRIPLTNFYDIGAWNNERNKWINSRGIFDWTDIRYIVFENQDKEIKKGVSFRNIRLTK